MSTTTRHPLAEAVARLHSTLDEVAQTATWSLDQTTTADLLGDLARAHGLVVEPGRHVLEVRSPGLHKGPAVDPLVRLPGASGRRFAGAGDAAHRVLDADAGARAALGTRLVSKAGRCGSLYYGAATRAGTHRRSWLRPFNALLRTCRSRWRSYYYDPGNRPRTACRSRWS